MYLHVIFHGKDLYKKNGCTKVILRFILCDKKVAVFKQIKVTSNMQYIFIR